MALKMEKYPTTDDLKHLVGNFIFFFGKKTITNETPKHLAVVWSRQPSHFAGLELGSDFAGLTGHTPPV